MLLVEESSLKNGIKDFMEGISSLGEQFILMINLTEPGSTTEAYLKDFCKNLSSTNVQAIIGLKTDLCFACEKVLVPGNETTRCGVCKTPFHDSCTGADELGLAHMKNLPAFFWKCSQCNEVPKKASASHSTITEPTVTAGCTDQSSPSSQPHRPSSYATIASRSNAPANVAIAGSSTESPNLVTAQRRVPQQFYLHLGGLANNVTVKEVSALVSKALATKDVFAVLLLRKGVDPASRRTLSFKVRIPESCREKALRCDSWPAGVRSREFRLMSQPHTDTVRNGESSLNRTLLLSDSCSPSSPCSSAPSELGIVSTPRRSSPQPTASPSKLQRMLTHSQNTQ